MTSYLTTCIYGILAAPLLYIVFYEIHIYATDLWEVMVKDRADYLAYERQRAAWNAARKHELFLQQDARLRIPMSPVVQKKSGEEKWKLCNELSAVLQKRVLPVRAYRRHYAIETLLWLPHDMRLRWWSDPLAEPFMRIRDWREARERMEDFNTIGKELEMLDMMFRGRPPPYTPT